MCQFFYGWYRRKRRKVGKERKDMETKMKRSWEE